MYRTIIVERCAEGFATLTLNRPDRLSVLSLELRRELAAAVDALEADPDVRVLVLTGAEKVFTAGKGCRTPTLSSRRLETTRPARAGVRQPLTGPDSRRRSASRCDSCRA
jgi:enoyl-CoA hydratase/carnithine racemase